MSQESLFDDAAHARADGIGRADHNADRKWKADALDAVRWCAANYSEFTADQVWIRLDAVSGARTHEPSALGPVFMRAARLAYIEKTGYVRASTIARRHRDLTVWRGTGKA